MLKQTPTEASRPDIHVSVISRERVMRRSWATLSENFVIGHPQRDWILIEEARDVVKPRDVAVIVLVDYE